MLWCVSYDHSKIPRPLPLLLLLIVAGSIHDLSSGQGNLPHIARIHLNKGLDPCLFAGKGDLGVSRGTLTNALETREGSELLGDKKVLDAGEELAHTLRDPQ